MKQGGTLESVLTELERQARTKRDFRAPRRLLKMSDQHQLMLSDIGTFGITNIGHEQLSARLNIPKEYYDRVRNSNKELLASNVNHWLENTADEINLVRTLDENVRGFLGPGYRPLDTISLMPIIIPLLKELEMEIRSIALTEKNFYLKVTTPKFRAEVKPGDVIEFGTVFSNSENGYSSFSIEDFVLRLFCMNGAISETVLRRRHIGKRHREMLIVMEEQQELLSDEAKVADDKAFFLKVRDLARSRLTQENFEQLLDKLRGATKRDISNTETLIHEVQNKFDFFNEDMKQIEILLHKHKDYTQYGLGNAVTSFAKSDEISYEKATELEKLGAQIMELGDTEWNVLQG